MSKNKSFFGNFDVDELELNFDTKGFGPQNSSYEFLDQFDGRLFKPYNKKEKLGKLCEISAQQAVPVAKVAKVGENVSKQEA